MLSNKFLRFCIVGIINTLVDVPLFVALHSAGFSVLLANICSTTLALIVSLALNYRFTFQNQGLTFGRIVVYIAVTLAGIWVLQPLVISGLLTLNDHMHFTAGLTRHFGHTAQLNSLLAKLSSLVVSLAWNYAWYSRVVFRDAPRSDQLGETIQEL